MLASTNMDDSDEESVDNNKLNKDQRSRIKKKICMREVGKLVKTVSDDTSFEKSWNWDKKRQSVKNARKKLNDPQFLLDRLTSIIMKNPGRDVRKIDSALQELQSILQQSKNLGLNQDGADEIHKLDPIPLNGNEDLQKKVEELRKEMEESQSFGEELKQILDMLEKKHQLIAKALVYTRVANLLQKVVDPCITIAQNNILNQKRTHQVEGHHGVEIQGEQIKLHFSQTTDSIQINEKGKNAEVHNQEMIDQEKQGGQLILTIRSEAGRLAELILAKPFLVTQNDFHLPECGGNLDSFLVKNVTATNGDEGTSTAAANEANLKLLPDETCIVQGYNRNAKALAGLKEMLELRKQTQDCNALMESAKDPSKLRKKQRLQ